MFLQITKLATTQAARVSDTTTGVLGLFHVTNVSVHIETVVHNSGVSLTALSFTIK